jgi:serine/threonine-protein kinase RsbW
MLDDLRIESQFSELARARAWVSEHARAAGIAEQEINEIRLAVSEACANVIEHAYRGEPDHLIDLHLEIDAERVLVTIRDHGEPFDPQSYHPPDLDTPQVGGYGVFLIRSLMDEVHYEAPERGGATLTLVKYHRAEPCTAASGEE